MKSMLFSQSAYYLARQAACAKMKGLRENFDFEEWKRCRTIHCLGYARALVSRVFFFISVT